MGTQALMGVAIDPTTTEGFLAIAQRDGRDAAHEARIEALRAKAALADGRGWNDTLTRARVGAALYDRAWEMQHPLVATLRTERGIAPQL